MDTADFSTMTQEQIENYLAYLKCQLKGVKTIGEPVECESKLNADFAKP